MMIKQSVIHQDSRLVTNLAEESMAVLLFGNVKCIYKTDNFKYAKERRKIVPEIQIFDFCSFFVLYVFLDHASLWTFWLDEITFC